METPERYSREREAVFVGRASFRVITAYDDAGGGSAEAATAFAPTPSMLDRTQPISLAQPGIPAEPGAPRAQAGGYAPSEPVLLLPPDSVTEALRARTLRHPTPPQLSTAEFDERPSSRRQSTPLWAIAAALILGATATLSAQAIMRRPAKWATAAAGAAEVPARGSHAGKVLEHSKTSSADIGAVTISPPVPTGTVPPRGDAIPTVVPSTAIAPPEGRGPTDAGSTLKRVVTAERPRPARAGAPSPMRGRGDARPAKVVAKGSTWVDPFVGDNADAATTVRAHGHRSRSPGKNAAPAGADAANTRRASGGERAPASAAGPAWVDPFVN